LDVLSVRLMVAVRVPLVTGAKVTVMVHDLLAARGVVVEQVVVSEKELALVPPSAIEEISRGAVPVFETVTVWAVASTDPT